MAKPREERGNGPAGSIRDVHTARAQRQAEKFIQEASFHFSQIEEMLNKFPKSRLVSVALTEIEKTALVVDKAISRLHDGQEG